MIHHVYHIVDGQQRLTTFIIFLQAFVDFFKTLPENKDKSEENLYISDEALDRISSFDSEGEFLACWQKCVMSLEKLGGRKPRQIRHHCR